MALAVTLATPLSAQDRSAASVDLTLGPSAGWGGSRHYYNEGAIAGEITIGIRPDREAPLTFALTVGGRGSIEFGDKCLLDTTAPNIGCRPHYPAVGHVGVLGGLERSAGVGELRVLVGPAVYSRNDGKGLGGQFQLDAAVGPSHFALLMAARGSTIAFFNGERLRLGSLGFGFRIR